ncbi:MFS transporter [Paenibacillus sp. N1-5-1-14]|uniref:MFS transporter n=1 Tax=Paenibacillus radicibacter TaxID=2972488 RepID=UPI0021597A67|nr:MFS transporter [Paenibacillus radicibacter]MCR8641249.1 MFS transporter [Paenibacillus radicibacter]
MTQSKSFAFRAEFILLALLLFIIEFVRGAFLVSFLPVYGVNELGFSKTIIGVAVSVHYVVDTTVKLFAGYFLDRFSMKLVVIVGLITSLVGLVLLYSPTQEWILILASALFGVGITPLWLVCLTRVTEDKRAQQMGALYTVWLVGLGSGPVVINLFIDRGFLLTYWILVGLWAICTLLAFFMPKLEGSSIPKTLPMRKQVELLWQRLRKMKLMLPGMILQTAAAGMLLPILPNFASHALGLSYTEYSYVLTAGGAMTVLLLVPMGKLSDRFGKKWFLVLGFGGFSLGLLGLTFSTSLIASILLAAFIGLSYSAVLPAWNALLAGHVPKEQQGMGWGLFSSIEGIGVVIGPVIGGWLAQQFSDTLTIGISSLILGGIAIFYLVLSTSFYQEEKPNNTMKRDHANE